MKEKFSKEYGETFARLREQRHFLLTDFKAVGLSVSTLSRFENGEQILRYHQLDASLELMKIEVGEFEYFTNGFESDYFIEICNQIEEANYQKNHEKLREIYEESTKYNQRLISLATKNLLKELTPLEKAEIRDHLFAITEWSFFELSILSFVIEQLSSMMRASILKDFLKNNVHYMSVSKYREKIFQIICRAAVGEIHHGNREISQELLENVNMRLNIKDVFPRCMYLFVKGIWDYNYGEQASGKQEMEDAITVYTTLGNGVLASYYQGIYKQETKVFKKKNKKIK